MGQLEFVRLRSLFQSPVGWPRQPGEARSVIFFRRNSCSWSLNANQVEQEPTTLKPLAQLEKRESEEKVSQVMPKISLYTPSEERKEAGEGEEFYEPKGGDIVVGMIVSGNANVLDVDIGARELAMMFTREVTPFDKFKLEERMWGDFESAQSPPAGRACIVKDEELANASASELIVQVGTVLQMVVMGKTLSGKALLSVRNLFRPVAWQRVRDIYSMEGVVEVCIESYNTGGLICRIEGLTAFLPKDMIQNMPRDFTGLKDYVGKRLSVMVILVEESKARILVSERAAWVQQLAPPYSLVQGSVIKVLAYGVIVRVDDTDISALLHVSSISHKRITSVTDVFSEGDKLKAVVMRPRVPDKVMLSTAVLEREKGSMLKDKEKVFKEAEEVYIAWKMEKDRYVDEIRKSNKTISSQEARDAELEKIANIHRLRFEGDASSG